MGACLDQWSETPRFLTLLTQRSETSRSKVRNLEVSDICSSRQYMGREQFLIKPLSYVRDGKKKEACFSRGRGRERETEREREGA
jgi:hypothetical protein